MWRSFRRKKKPSKDRNGKKQRTTLPSDNINKLTNYSEAIQLAQTLKSENNELRHEVEYLKHKLDCNNTNSKLIQIRHDVEDCQSTATKEQQQDQQQQLALQQQQLVLQQQKRISELEASLKDAAPQWRSPGVDDESVTSYMCDTIRSMDATLKKFDYGEMKTALNDTIHRHDTIIKRLDSREKQSSVINTEINGTVQRLLQRCNVLEETLKKEMKDHSDLQMKLSKLNTEDIVKSQTEIEEIVNRILETTKQAASKLTDILVLAEADSGRSSANMKNLPPYLFGFALQVENEMEDMDKAKKLGLALGISGDRVTELSRECGDQPKELFWKELHEWIQETDQTQCLAVIISACQELGICPFQDDLMSAEHSTAIEKSYSSLEKDIYVNYLVSHLRDHAVLSVRDVDYILDPKTRVDQFRRLVAILPLFGGKAFDYFVDALMKSGQQHLAVILLDELKKVTKDPVMISNSVVKTSQVCDVIKKLSDWTDEENNSTLTRLLATLITAVNHNKEMLTNLTDK